MSGLYQVKNQRRQLARQRRRALPLRDISGVVMARLKAWDVFQEAQVVLGYWPLFDEIDISPLIFETKDTKTWYLPRVLSAETRWMEFYRFEGPEKMELGPYSIKYPVPSCLPLEMEARPIDLIIVPALELDIYGNRLGSGKGYYDRYLTKLEAKGQNPTKIGVCPEQMLFERLPAEPTDAPLDYVITQDKVFETVEDETLLVPEASDEGEADAPE